MSINSVYLLAIVAISLAGCAAVSEQAQKIQLHAANSTAIVGCKRIAPLIAKESRFKLSADEFLLARLRQDAVAVGADSIVILTMEEGLTEIVAQGVAYKCF